ncbi:MAG: hypothetical protein IKZ34_00115 [Alphaproteobacteria bacterium]|nr:hypothetical protein [Alphaproteobacteria bacterium]
MQLKLIKNTDMFTTLSYQVARVVYEQAGAVSLNVVEALTSMIQNLSNKTGVDISCILSDKTLFSDENKIAKTEDCVNSRKFQMCVRVASRMLAGGLPDCCHGATRFHHASYIPDWAIARGYIDDVDGLLFYL